jgi:hypothetical protein
LTAFCSAAQQVTLGFAKKSNSNWLDSVLPRRTKATQIDRILFCRAAKDFGICQQTQLKLTLFCSVVQRKTSNLPQKQLNWLYFVLPQRKFLEFDQKTWKICFLKIEQSVRNNILANKNRTV